MKPDFTPLVDAVRAKFRKVKPKEDAPEDDYDFDDDGSRCRVCERPCEDDICDECQNAIYRSCPGGGMDDLCSGDPEHCGLCRP